MPSDIPMSKIRDHWRSAFPHRWEKLVEMAAPFYSESLNFDLKPARPTAESELRDAMNQIAPGDVWKTSMGKKRNAKDSIIEFSSVLRGVEFVTKVPSRCRVSAFRNIVGNHVGSFIDDQHRNLHPAFHGSSSSDPLSLGNRVEHAFKRSVYRTWPISEEIKPADISPINLSILAGAVTSVLFMGLHFASIGDESRDFNPLLRFLLSGNYPISTRQGEQSKGGRKETKDPLCCILLLCT